MVLSLLKLRRLGMTWLRKPKPTEGVKLIEGGGVGGGGRGEAF
jgi:hypothetical protein